jgi:hypothetical protein
MSAAFRARTSSLVVSTTRTALFALGLSACAHQSAGLAPRVQSYPGGRSAQPGGFIAVAEGTSFAQAPTAGRHGASYLGGRAGQAYGWPGEGARVASVEAPAYCLNAGGRAAQPFSGPTLRVVRREGQAGKHAICRSEGAALRF